jgi:hypothetical protein
VKGFFHGLRHRSPVANSEVSRLYRTKFHSYASPWWFSRPPGEFIRSAPKELASTALGREIERPPGRREEYFAERAQYYPTTAATLQLAPSRGPGTGRRDAALA